MFRIWRPCVVLLTLYKHREHFGAISRQCHALHRKMMYRDAVEIIAQFRQWRKSCFAPAPVPLLRFYDQIRESNNDTVAFVWWQNQQKITTTSFRVFLYEADASNNEIIRDIDPDNGSVSSWAIGPRILLKHAFLFPGFLANFERFYLFVSKNS